jgi:methyl-accepting chemotaxis protein
VKPATTHSARRRPGGSITLGVSVVYFFLLITLFFGLWFTLERQNRAAHRADNYASAVGVIQMLLRGLNEVAVTEGASASRTLATNALKELANMRSSLDEGALDRGGRGNFDDLQKRMAAFIAEKDVSPSNMEVMISLGRMSTEAGKLSDLLTSDAQQARSDANISLRLTRMLLLCAALLALVGTVVNFMIFHRRIRQPVNAAITVAERISSGDLSQPVATNDAGEIARLMLALEAMQASLAQVVSEVNNTTGDVVASAAQLSSGSADLSTRTEVQATTLEETAASMEEITTTVRNTSEHSRRASDLARKAAATASESDAVVITAVEKITAIRENSGRISEITSVIDGIAFQTNILALNAAVEAARAGEQGRGFSVVASEVRALAQRSASAAREIKSLIAASASDVEAGTALVHQAGDAMKNILAASEAVVKVINEISVEMADQARGIGQINIAISQMEQTTQQNAAMVEQAANSAEAMRTRAEELQDAVGRFKLAGHSHIARHEAIPAAHRPKSQQPTSARHTALTHRS